MNNDDDDDNPRNSNDLINESSSIIHVSTDTYRFGRDSINEYCNSNVIHEDSNLQEK